MTVLIAPKDTVDANADGLVRVMGMAQWAQAGWHETGIIGDTTGAAWKVTANGSGFALPVGAVGNRAVIAGFHAEITAAETINVSTLGTAPTSAQFRRDRIVLRLSLTTFRGVVTHLPGTVAATEAAAVAPVVVQSTTSWDLPLCSLLRRGTGAIQAVDVLDERTWIGPQVVGQTLLTLPVLGTVQAGVGDRRAETWRRVLDTAGTAIWRRDSRMAHGDFSGSTDGAGLMTITHDLGMNPNAYGGVINGPNTTIRDNMTLIPTGISTTQLTFLVQNKFTGIALGSNPVTTYWWAFA